MLTNIDTCFDSKTIIYDQHIDFADADLSSRIEYFSTSPVLSDMTRPVLLGEKDR